MYEHKKQPIASTKVYYARLWKNALIALVVMFISLLIGMVGYKLTIPEFSWYDCLLNASMILSGMGPVFDATIQLSNTAKVFASFYALFSGITFITNIGMLTAPIVHRFFHKLHLED
jgi:hypothetical protein